MDWTWLFTVQTWIQIPALLLASFMNLTPELQFPYL